MRKRLKHKLLKDLFKHEAKKFLEKVSKIYIDEARTSANKTLSLFEVRPLNSIESNLIEKCLDKRKVLSKKYT